MKTRYEPLVSRIGPEMRPGLDHEILVHSKERLGARLEAFKNRLLKKLLDQSPSMAFHAPLRRAANEAAAVVWLTPYPLFILPVLIEEKARAACEQAVRQKRIKLHSQQLIEDVV